jgi:OmpA-OmpF porin, OOP family
MKRSLIGLAAVVALFATSAAYAQGYVGFGAGPSKINIDCLDAPTCDKTDTGYKLYGGWRFMPNLAAEAVYVDWGKAKASGTDPELGTATLDVKASGFGVGVAYHIPLAAWSCLGRLGIMQNKGKTTVTLGSLSGSDSFTGTFPYYGVGCGYSLTPNLTLTLEGDFSRVKYTDQDKANVQLLSVGLRWGW